MAEKLGDEYWSSYKNTWTPEEKEAWLVGHTEMRMTTVTEKDAKKILGDIYVPRDKYWEMHPPSPELAAGMAKLNKKRKKQKKQAEDISKPPGARKRKITTVATVRPDDTRTAEAQEAKDMQVIMKIKDIVEKKFKAALIEIGELIIDNGYVTEHSDVWKDWGPRSTYRDLVKRPEFPMSATRAWDCVKVAKMLRFINQIEGGIDIDHLTFSHLLTIATMIKGVASTRRQIAKIRELVDNPMSVAELEQDLKPFKINTTAKTDEQKALAWVNNLSIMFDDTFADKIEQLDIAQLQTYVGASDEQDLFVHLDVYIARIQRTLTTLVNIREKFVQTSGQEDEFAKKVEDLS